jgi:hypothetical protein
MHNPRNTFLKQNRRLPSPLSEGAHLMGAAFNLRLLLSDARWAHDGTTY